MNKKGKTGSIQSFIYHRNEGRGYRTGSRATVWDA